MVQNIMALTVVLGAIVYVIWSVFKKPVAAGISKCSGCSGCALKDNLYKNASFQIHTSVLKN